MFQYLPNDVALVSSSNGSVQFYKHDTERQVIIKRPARDACLCIGELPAPPAPHFVFLITL